MSTFARVVVIRMFNSFLSSLVESVVFLQKHQFENIWTVVNNICVHTESCSKQHKLLHDFVDFEKVSRWVTMCDIGLVLRVT